MIERRRLKDVAIYIQRIFKSKLNEISNGGFQSKEQKSALEKTKLLCESRQAVGNKLLLININKS